MNRMQKYLFATAFLMVVSLTTYAQVAPVDHLDRQDQKECAQNIAIWLKMLELKPSPGLMEDLADCYAKIEDHASAAQWYAESQTAGNDDPECIRKMAGSLKAIGHYDEALAQMRKYTSIAGTTAAIQEFIQACETLIAQRFQHGRFEIQLIEQLSSAQSEIMACRHENDMYFYSRASKRKLGRPHAAASQNRPFSLYAMPIHAAGKHRHIRVVARTTCPDEMSLGMVWDQSCKDYYVVKSEKVATEKNPPAIFRSWLDYKGYIGEEKLLLNGALGSSNFHPAVSADGKILIFASDREGGFGGTDLYLSFRAKDVWSDPQNLGPLINTVRDESYPSFSAAGKLFFASNGHPGFGGFDIYASELKDGEWTAAINVGAEMNSTADDFALVWNLGEDGNTGYFTSNRREATRCDLYSFTRHPEVAGIVRDAVTQAPIAQAHVTLTALGAAGVDLPVSTKGDYAGFLDQERTYYVEATADGYERKGFQFDARQIGQGDDLHFDISLTPLRSYTLKGQVTDLLNGMPIDNIALRIINGETGEVLQQESKLGSDFSLQLAPGIDYALLFQKPGYNSAALHVPLKEFRGHRVEEQPVRMSPGQMVLLVGRVTDANGARLDGVSQIDVVNMKTKAVMQQKETDRQGNFSLWISRDLVGTYALFASHPGVATSHVQVLADDDQYLPFRLDELPLSLAFASRELHYDYGQKVVTDNSRAVLDDIYFYLVHNPDVSVELRTYADARGTDAANMDLTEQRSLALINDLLLRGGLSPERLRHAFFGETRLKNECGDGVDCPEDKHAANRRTEVYFFLTSAPSAAKVGSAE